LGQEAIIEPPQGSQQMRVGHLMGVAVQEGLAQPVALRERKTLWHGHGHRLRSIAFEKPDVARAETIIVCNGGSRVAKSGLATVRRAAALASRAWKA
jgi:hypothetical protein